MGSSLKDTATTELALEATHPEIGSNDTYTSAGADDGITLADTAVDLPDLEKKNGVVVPNAATNLNGFQENVTIEEDRPRPTDKGGYTHTAASKAKISAANKGRTPWNKGQARPDDVKARIAAGVRARNRQRFLEKLEKLGMTEEEYTEQKKAERRKKDAERRARRTENGGYRLTDETKQKISRVLKEKWASGQVSRRKADPSKVRRGFTHSPETRAKISESLRKRWADDPSYRENMIKKSARSNTSNEVRQKISETLKRKWEDPEFREEMMKKITVRSRPGGSLNEQHREKISAAMKAKWKETDYRNKTLGAIARRRQEMGLTRPRKPPTRAKAPARRSPPKQRNTPGEIRMVQPLTAPHTTTKAKRKVKRKTKKKIRSVVSGETAGAEKRSPKGSQQEPSVPSKPKTDTPKKKRKKTEPDGSVRRLREERRDLYDLLYGDEDNSDGDDLLRPVSTNGRSIKSSSPLARLDLGDENLDDFDPYGLEDH